MFIICAWLVRFMLQIRDMRKVRRFFLLAYHRAPIGKNILYRLIEVSLKMQDIEEAEEFL